MANLNFTLTQDAVTAFVENKKITITAIEYYDSNNTLRVRIDDVITSISTITADQRVLSIAGGYSSQTPPETEIKIFKIFVKCRIEDQSSEIDFAKYIEEDITNPIYIFAANKDFTISVLLKLGIQANDADVIEVTGQYSIAPATTSREGVVQLATPAQVLNGTKTSDNNMPLVVQPGDGFSIRDTNIHLYADADDDIAFINTDGDAYVGLTNQSVTISAVDDELQVKNHEVNIGSPGDDFAFNVYGNQTIKGGLSVDSGELVIQNNHEQNTQVDDYYRTHLFHLVKDEGWSVVVERARTSGINNCFFYTRNKNIVSDLGKSANLIKGIGLYGLTTGTFTYNNDSYFYAYNPNKEIEVNPLANPKPTSSHKYYFCFLCKGYNSQEAFNAEKWYFGVIEITSSDNWNFSIPNRDAFFTTAADPLFIVHTLPDNSILNSNLFSVGQKFEVKNNVHTPDKSGHFKYFPDLYLIYYYDEIGGFLKTFEYTLSSGYNYNDSDGNWHNIYHNFDSYPTMEPYASKLGGFYTEHYSEIPRDSYRNFSSKELSDFFPISDREGNQARGRWVILGNKTFSPYGSWPIGYEIVTGSDSEFSFDSYAEDEMFRKLGYLDFNLYLYYNAFYLDTERVFVANKDFVGEKTWSDLFFSY